MSWVRTEIDQHERDVLELREQDIAVPRGIAVTDLRVLVDRCLYRNDLEAWPGYRRLAKRWGWGEKRARLLVEDVAGWCDPTRLAGWRNLYAEHEGRNEGATRAQEGRNEGAIPNGSTPATNETGRNEGAGRAQRGRKKGHTRGEDHDHDHPSQEIPAPYPRPSGPGARQIDPAVEWVATTALSQLAALEGPDLEATCKAFQQADRGLVSRWLTRWVRPDRRSNVRPAEGAPEGLRRRQAAEGLRESAARWLRLDALFGLSTDALLLASASPRAGPVVLPADVDLSGVPPPLILDRVATLLDLRRPPPPEDTS